MHEYICYTALIVSNKYWYMYPYNCYIYAITPRIRIRIATGSGCYNVLKHICVNRFFKTYILFSESNPSRKGANFSYGLGYLNPMKCHINFHCQSHRKINLSSRRHPILNVWSMYEWLVVSPRYEKNPLASSEEFAVD
jgi:hypothetical protein